MTFVEFNLTHTTAINNFSFFDSAKEAVSNALETGLLHADDSEVSVYLMIDCDGDRRWAIQPGHRGSGVHCTQRAAARAEDWFEDDWGYTTDRELADSSND